MKPILTALLFCATLAAQPPVASAPATCNIEFNFTATAQVVQPLNNIYTGCVNWYIYYSAYGVMGLSLTVQSAADAGGARRGSASSAPPVALDLGCSGVKVCLKRLHMPPPLRGTGPLGLLDAQQENNSRFVRNELGETRHV